MNIIDIDARDKYAGLISILEEMECVAVAYSGGVDSTFLAKAASDALGNKAFAVLGVSPTVARSELSDARKLAVQFGLQLIEVFTEEMSDPDYIANPSNRCYYCKTELFAKIRSWADTAGVKFVCDGTNADDIYDWRPGAQAAREKEVRSPLQEAGLTKAEIRLLSREMGLPTWDKPSIACLGSRFPYGTKITPEAVNQLDDAEDLLRSFGFKQVRVRHHGDVARIEVEQEDIERLASAEIRQAVDRGLKRIGFKYVAVDLAGYKTGNLNIGVARSLDTQTDI